MTFNDLKAYFSNYAALHPALRHSEANKAFIALHSENGADEFIKTCKSPTILVLITPDKKMLPPQSENYNWDKYVVFFILQKCGRKNEVVIIQAQNDCEQIANDFVTRLIADRHTLITGLQQESIVVQPVGPMTDDFYGQACMFSLIDNFDYRVNPEKWLG